MSNKAIEQALVVLLPTHAHALPPELIKLASALLVQSRSYSASLKPVEEIARPHVCAEIACKSFTDIPIESDALVVSATDGTAKIGEVRLASRQ